MRDRLKRPYLDNLPGKNPTQTHYTRFMKSPTGRIRTIWNVAQENLNRMKDWQKASHYTAFMEQ